MYKSIDPGEWAEGVEGKKVKKVYATKLPDFEQISLDFGDHFLSIIIGKDEGSGQIKCMPQFWVKEQSSSTTLHVYDTLPRDPIEAARNDLLTKEMGAKN